MIENNQWNRGKPLAQDLKTALILSTGRTGTMFLAKFLEEKVTQALVYHEAGGRSRMVNILANANICGLLPDSAPKWAWHRVVPGQILACNKNIYIDSNNQFYGLVPFLRNLYPNIRVIHIIRDPRTYVRSHLNWSRHRPKSFIANYLVPFWQPNPFLVGEMDFAKWFSLSKFERFAWIWDFKNRYIEKTVEFKIPYLCIRFEDLFSESHSIEALIKIQNHIGVKNSCSVNDGFKYPINPNKGSSFPTWPNWSLKRVRQLFDICGSTMNRYSYGNEKEWLDKLQYLRIEN